jgi:hypothetical protein
MKAALRACAAMLAAATLGAACTSVETQNTVRKGEPPICPGGGEIGPVLVSPQTHWRKDQKEREKREDIAMAAIGAAFTNMPCARVVRLAPIGEETNATVLREMAGDARTIVVIRIQELGPTLEIGFPVLWSGYSDIRFDVVVIDTRSGAVRLDMERHRKVGGPGAIRGVDPLQAEFEAALRGVIAPES